MENPNNIICLFSNYSPSCNKILEKITKYSLNFIKLVCIDNKQARDILKYKLKSVPCVIITYSNGNIEIYEGIDCIEWFNEIINNKIRQEIEEKVSPAILEKTEENKILTQKVEELSNLVQILKQKEIENKNVNNIPKSSGEGGGKSGNKFTSIDDLGDDNLPADNNPQKSVSAAVKKSSSLLERAKELEKGRDDLTNKKQNI